MSAKDYESSEFGLSSEIPDRSQGSERCQAVQQFNYGKKWSALCGENSQNLSCDILGSKKSIPGIFTVK